MFSDTDNTNQPTVDSVDQTDQNQNQTGDEDVRNYEMLHKNEVDYNQKLRSKNQGLEKELDNFRLEKETARQKKLEEQGNYQQLLTERDAVIEKQNATISEHNQYFENEKSNILATFSDEDKEAFGDLPLSKLKVIQTRLQNGGNNPSAIPESQDKSMGEFGGFVSMAEWASRDPSSYKKANNQLSGITIGYSE